MVASEAVPFAKTGGLADVVAALPKALGALGHDVTVVIPRYRGIPITGAPTTSYSVSMGGHDYLANVYVQQTSPGVRVALVDHPAFFDRDALYGLGSQDYGDNPRRFAFLCLAALEFARLEGQPIDIVHAHDWQGGLAPVYLKTRYAGDPVLGRRGNGLHDSQHRVPGKLLVGLAPAARPRLGRVHDRRPRVLAACEPAQGRDHVRGPGDRP